MTFKKFAKEWLPFILIIVAAVIFRIFFMINANIPTGSMNDTIPTGARVIGWKFAYWNKKPERGDIIIFDAPDEPGKLLVKRVIGIPGDVVVVKDGTVTINGVLQVEPYVRETKWGGGNGTYEVPEGSYFCMGDNRNNSHDGRYWTNKYVKLEAIEGRASFIYWPFSSFGTLK